MKIFFYILKNLIYVNRLLNKGKHIFTAKELKIHHLGFKSSLGEEGKDHLKYD